jgi:hypothetical protein
MKYYVDGTAYNCLELAVASAEKLAEKEHKNVQILSPAMTLDIETHSWEDCEYY